MAPAYCVYVRKMRITKGNEEEIFFFQTQTGKVKKKTHTQESTMVCSCLIEICFPKRLQK